MQQLTYSDYKPNAMKLPVWVLLDDVITPRNTGVIFRIADTMGAQGLVLCGNVPPSNHKLLSRTAKGADRHVPFVYYKNATDAIEDYRKQGFLIVALEITDQSSDIKTIDFQQFDKILLIAGAEDSGVSQAVLDIVDFAVHIPTSGLSLSMNVAVSVAIAVYEIRRQLEV
ncbi:MAG: hypothetical protein JNL70_04535 [Saprospiraceae bacterium]|nr:hypothetical protein [Saprospiraceae bacterium]